MYFLLIFCFYQRLVLLNVHLIIVKIKVFKVQRSDRYLTMTPITLNTTRVFLYKSLQNKLKSKYPNTPFNFNTHTNTSSYNDHIKLQFRNEHAR